MATEKMDSIKETKKHYGFEDYEWSELSKSEKIQMRKDSYDDLKTGQNFSKPKKVKISKLKKGDYFKKTENASKIFMYEGKMRKYDFWGEYKGWGFGYSDVEDISHEAVSKKDIEVIEIDY